MERIAVAHHSSLITRHWYHHPNLVVILPAPLRLCAFARGPARTLPSESIKGEGLPTPLPMRMKLTLISHWGAAPNPLTTLLVNLYDPWERRRLACPRQGFGIAKPLPYHPNPYFTIRVLIPHSGHEFNEPQRRKGRKVRTSGQRFGQFFFILHPNLV